MGLVAHVCENRTMSDHVQPLNTTAHMPLVRPAILFTAGAMALGAGLTLLLTGGMLLGSLLGLGGLALAAAGGLSIWQTWRSLDSVVTSLAQAGETLIMPAETILPADSP